MKKIDNTKEYALKLLDEVIGKKNGSIESIKPIHNGYTNLSYVVTYTNKKKYQVRFPHDGKIINRHAEYEILSLMKDQSFVYFDVRTGIAIKQWIDGKCPIIPTLWKWKHVDQLFSIIKKLHSMKPADKKHIKPIVFDSYNDNLYRLRVSYQIKVLSILHAYNDDPVVINHTDINAQNIILDKSGKIHLIDFEWCGYASDYWDYANFIRESNIKYEKIDWSKYIDNFNMHKLKEFIFASAVFAYLWTWKMPDSRRIRQYRSKTIRQIHRYARGVVGNE